MRCILGIIASLILSVPANAQSDLSKRIEQMSAKYILAACKEEPTEPQWRIGLCLGQIQMLYLLGCVDGLAPDRRFCPPPGGVSILDMRDVIVKYIESRPSEAVIPFYMLAVDALRNEWPCK
jgi:Rap1a immunity proteins